MSAPESPFNWRGKPSIFSSSQDHNGVNTQRARQKSSFEAKPIYLRGSTVYLSTPTETQQTAYSRAKAKKCPGK